MIDEPTINIHMCDFVIRFIAQIQASMNGTKPESMAVNAYQTSNCEIKPEWRFIATWEGLYFWRDDLAQVVG